MSARQTDVAGNTSAISTTLAITIDTTVPGIIFTNDVEVGPVLDDTVLITLTEANPNTSLQVYTFSADAVCDATDFSGGEPTFTS